MLILKSLMYSSTITALFAASLTAYSFLAINEPINKIIILFNFLGTFIAYNLIALITLYDKDIQSDSMNWLKSHKNKIVLSLCLLTPLLIYYSLSLKFILLINFIHLLLITLIYEKGLLLKFNLFFNFREKTYLKPLIISYCWTMACVLTPMLESSTVNWSLLLSSLLSVFSLCLMYDLRDIYTDKTEGLITIAHKLKRSHFKLLIFFIYTVSIIFRNMLIPISEHSSLFLCEILFLSFLIYKAKPDQDDYFYILISDGLIAFKLLYVLG